MVLLRSRSCYLLRSTICVAPMQSAIFILNAIYSASPTVWFFLSLIPWTKTEITRPNFWQVVSCLSLLTSTVLMQLCSALLSTNSVHTAPSLSSTRFSAQFSLWSRCSFLYIPLISSKTLLFSPFHQCHMDLALLFSKISP